MKNVSARIYNRVRTALPLGLGAFLLASVAVTIAAEGGGQLSPTSVQQIVALLQDKETRTLAQTKLDSQLIYARRQQLNQPIVPGAPTLQVNVEVEAGGFVLVDIKATVTDALLAQIRQLGGVILNSHSRFGAVRARVPLSQVETIAASPLVRFIRPAEKMFTNLGRLTTEGDFTHRAGLARTNFNIGGNGVKIGIISDSVDFIGQSQASGDLPNVTVLPGQSGVPGSGEGTAMLEIVADLAPKAQFYFATANGGQAQLAQNILDLRAAGCSVIIDDVIYLAESPFQDDVPARAVNTVTADGALYFSSAGNEGNKNDGTSGTWEGDFNPGQSFTAGTRTGVAHSYGTTIGNTIPPGGSGPLTLLFWSDVLGGSTNDYDLFLLDAAGNVLGGSTTTQNGTQDPIEGLSPALQGWQIVVVRISGESRFLHLECFRGELTFSTDGHVRGHAAAADAFAVAAVNVATAFPNSFVGGAANPVETFSADGPRRMFYDPQGNPYTPGNFLASGGIVRPKPEIAAADGVKTTVPGFDPFFGTSAAAPHAGAIAALLQSYNPRVTPQQIRFALTNTALDIEAPGFDRDSGWGIVMPLAALQRIPAPLPTLVSSNLSGGNLNGIIDVNECNELDLLVRNDAIAAVTSVSGILSTLTPGVTVVQPTSLYPTIPAGATVANLTPFRIYTAPTFNCGTPIDFVFVINSSAGNVTNTFRMNTGVVGFVPASFANTLVTDIPEGGTNYLDIPIAVSNLFGFIGKVRLSAHIVHPRDGDLTLQLIGPDGTTVTLSRQRGGTDRNYGLSCAEPTIFDDAGTTNIIAAFAPFAGLYAPEQSLTAFSGKSGAAVNGTWLLRVTDSFTSNTGRVQCVTLSMFPAQCADGGGDCSADLAVAMTDAPDPVLTGSNLVYTIVVTNLSARTAPLATITDTLPPGMTVVGITSTRGSCSSAAGFVSCAFGTLPPNGGALVRITVRPSLAGTATNTVSVNSLSADPNGFNNVAVVTTTVQTPRPIIVPFASHLLAESALPANGAFDPGETVTINFSFRNIGTVDATNLNAKLLLAGGVTTIFTNNQDYGRVVAGGVAVSRPFALTVGGTNGGVINVMFQLQDGTNDLGLATFSFGIVGQSTFANQSVISIREGTNQSTAGPALPYPSTINVAGLSGLVANVTVTLSNFTHSFPADLDILLVGPGFNAPKVRLMSDAGASVSISSPIRLIFDDNAVTPVPQTNLIVAGTYRPTNYTPEDEFVNDSFSIPAPAGPYGAALAAFRGQNPNGVWSLFIYDDAAGDAGRIANGWSLSFNIIDPINPRLDLGVAVLDSPDPVKLNSNVTYTITVTNAGPEVSPAVQLTNLLSGGLAFVSVTNSQGVCTNDSGMILCDLGAINAGNSATVVIVATAVALTPQTLTATVGDQVMEFDYANNTASATTGVSAAADVGVRVTSAPNPATINTAVNYLITVTNRGPNTASSVRLTNLLAAGVVFVSATPSQGGCTPSASEVVCALGSMASGGSATVAISVNTPAAVRVLTNQVSAFAAVPFEPNPADNVASTVTTNYNPAFIIVASTALLVSESGPITGGIDPGETVAINFYLRNVGTTPTANLTASLVPGPSVVSPGGAQDYRVLLPGGATVGRTNSFTASGTNGELITVTLHVMDGSIDLGYIDFTFPLGNQVAYLQPNIVSVPVFGPAAVYPSTIAISNLTGTVSKVVVTLTNLSHTYPDDLDILLVSPGNRVVLILSDVGGATPVTGITLSLDDSAVNYLPNAAALVSGIFKPTNFDDSESDDLPAPAPSGPYATSLSTFDGIDANGVWSLYVYDDSLLDAGQIGGWSLTITTVGLVQPQPAVLSASTFQPAGQFQLRVNGEAGGNYRIEASSNLLQWTPISTNVLTSGTLFFNDPMSSGRVQRFYRALRLP